MGIVDVGRQGRSALLDAYLEHRAELLKHFTLRLRSASAAEDLVQDLFVRLQDIGDPQAREPLAYLYRMGANMMLDRMRSARRSALRDAAWRRAHVTAIRNEDIADDPDPVEALAARQRLAEILNALTTLAPQTRRVFHMHKLQGLSHSEVAAALGISRSAVEKHMIVALRHLAKRRP